MKRTILLLTLLPLLCFCLITPKALSGRLQSRENLGAFPAKWFTQKLDHFNPQDSRVFSQRYYENRQYYKAGGPSILYINGEGPVYGPPSSKSGYVVLLAQQIGANIVTLEHRYYGLSVPGMNLTTENLVYLTSRQALEDLASFQTWYTNTVLKNSDTKWVAIGGSYSGALSSWYRLKFPHLVVGALSSSGVVRAVLDFTEFDMYVSEAVGPECASHLRGVTAQLEDLVIRGNDSSKALAKRMLLADELVDDGDFFYFVADKMAEASQYGHGPKMCSQLAEAAKKTPNSNWALLQGFAAYADEAARTTGGAEWYATANHLETTATEEANARQWWYQTCVEVAYFQNAPVVNSIRSSWVNMTYHRKHCEALFGIGIWPDVAATNLHYGGNHTHATNVYYSNGSQDPWLKASVVSELSPSQPVGLVRCSNCGHCVDLGGCPGGCTDQKSLDAVRNDITSYILRWLK